MIISFDVKYGKNIIELSLLDGSTVKTEFVAKYGNNKVIFPTKDYLTIDFNLKYGHNKVVAEVTENTEAIIINKKLVNLWDSKVTIYNDILADGVNNRRFDRFVIEQCNIQKGALQNADGTIEKVVNAQTVTTRDIEHYKPPLEYKYLPADEKDKYFTVQVNDVVILGEVDDVVTSRRELDDLLTEKYKNNGFSVTAVNEYIHGMAVDNVQIIHA